MSMGRWVFLFIPIFSAAFSGGVCVQVLCHRGGGDGLQSHADEEEGLYLASIYLSISASIEKRSNWKQLLKPTYGKGEAEEDCGEENWMARGEFSFGWRKTGTMQGKQSVRRISKILRKKYRLLEFWLRREWKNFLGREIMVSDWRNICLVQFWSFLGGTSPISVPDATWPFWGILTDSQSSLLATKSSTLEIILQLLFRLTKI